MVEQEWQEKITEEITAMQTTFLHSVIRTADKFGVNRDDLLSQASGIFDLMVNLGTFKNYELPATDNNEPVKRGKWEENGIAYVCSLCHRSLVIEQGDANMNFCPNCGARMEGDTE